MPELSEIIFIERYAKVEKPQAEPAPEQQAPEAAQAKGAT
jgi:hypothetical protein